MEVHAAKVAGSIVALVISLASLACLAIGKKRLVGRRVDGDPDLARGPVHAVGVTAQFMLTAEAVGIVCADGTLQSQHPTGRSLCSWLKGWRCAGRAVHGGRGDHGFSGC